MPERLSKGLGLPPAELGRGSSSPTQTAPRRVGSLGGACGWLGGQWSSQLGRPHIVPLSLKVVALSSIFSLPTCKVVAVPGAPLGQRIDGVDGRRGLRALVAFRLLLVLFDRVLADEGAVLIELALAALAIVH